jgi:hypothetical protein
VDHPAWTFLIDHEGMVRYRYLGSLLDVETIREDMQALWSGERGSGHDPIRPPPARLSVSIMRLWHLPDVVASSALEGWRSSSSTSSRRPPVP